MGSTEDYATQASDNVDNEDTTELQQTTDTVILDDLGTTASVSSIAPVSVPTTATRTTDAPTTVAESRGLYCVLSLKLAKTKRLFGYSAPDQSAIWYRYRTVP